MGDSSVEAGHRHDHAGQDHSPGHGHSHDHSIQVTADSEKRVFLAMMLTGLFMVVEVFGGFWAGSLALLADAGHMLGDFVSLFLAWLAFKLSKRQSDLRRTYR